MKKDCKDCLEWLGRTILIFETLIKHFQRRIKKVKEIEDEKPT